MIWELDALIRSANSNRSSKDGKTYFPSRPDQGGINDRRWYGAWLVLTGRADAVIWPAGQ